MTEPRGTLVQVALFVLMHALLDVLPAGAQLPSAIVPIVALGRRRDSLSRHGLQVAMEVCFVAADQEPAGQREHTETAPPPYLPASQLVQSVLAAEVFKTPVAE
jgi:hypothetical protein